MPEFIEYANREQAAQALAGRLESRLADAVAAREQATLVVSGGSSPVGLFRALAGKPLPWSGISVLPTDERWVPVTDERSNEGMMRRELLREEAAAARFVGLYREGLEVSAALADINSALAEIPRPLDAVVLGMGTDGHTASLFPDAPDIERSLASEADAVAAAVGPPPRVSLTLRRLCDARSIDLLFFGEDKRRVYDKACEPGPLTTYPVRGVLMNQTIRPVVHWAR